MSKIAADQSLMGLSEEEADSLGERRAVQVRTFRLLQFIAQELRFLADRMYRADGITTQQAMLLTIVRAQGTPTLGDAARVFATSHQNVKQIAASLVKKGLLQMKVDPDDARRVRLRTTPKNERFWASRDPVDFAEVGTWFSSLSKREVKNLFALLMKLQTSVSTAMKDSR